MAAYPTGARRSPLQTAGAAALAGLDRERAEIEASGIGAEIQVRQWNPIAAGDLTALGNFRLQVKARESEIARRRLDAAQKLAEQQKLMLEARRRCRLLERLKERRLTEWTAERDHELEEIAAESYLATMEPGGDVGLLTPPL